jgi:nitrite reductase/ring-hydroxylating ferredoxin subunit
MTTVLGLHVAAALRERRLDRTDECADDFVYACDVEAIPEKRAAIVCLSGERVAVFRYDGRISAISNVCQHQNGPLGEGRIVDGCVTCPWHGYQYLPDTGASPPPFQEKVPTFRTKVVEGRVLIHPRPNPPGTRVEPAKIMRREVAAR